jgi:hypothetical protein
MAGALEGRTVRDRAPQVLAIGGHEQDAAAVDRGGRLEEGLDATTGLEEGEEVGIDGTTAGPRAAAASAARRRTARPSLAPGEPGP